MLNKGNLIESHRPLWFEFSQADTLSTPRWRQSHEALYQKSVLDQLAMSPFSHRFSSLCCVDSHCSAFLVLSLEQAVLYMNQCTCSNVKILNHEQIGQNAYMDFIHKCGACSPSPHYVVRQPVKKFTTIILMCTAFWFTSTQTAVASFRDFTTVQFLGRVWECDCVQMVSSHFTGKRDRLF